MTPKKTQLICPVCDTQFTKQRSWQVYCSAGCRMSHNAQKETARIDMMETRIRGLENDKAELTVEVSRLQREVSALTTALARAISP